MGAPAFGIAPGEATLHATLRTRTDEGMDALVARRNPLCRRRRRRASALRIAWHDIFAHSENDPEATRIAARALDAARPAP